jgi:hypothetical protein
LPLINIKQEPVNISIPWISTAEIERAIASRKTTIDLRQEELKKAVESWSL